MSQSQAKCRRQQDHLSWRKNPLKKALSALKSWTKHHRSGFIFVHPHLIGPLVMTACHKSIYSSLGPRSLCRNSFASIRPKHSEQFLWTCQSLFLLFFGQQIHLARIFFLWRCSWMIFSMVPRERPHLVLSSYMSYIEFEWIFFNCTPNHQDILLLCKCHKSSCPMVIRCFLLPKTKVFYPSAHVRSQTEDLPYTLVKSVWILIASSPSLNRVKL